MRKRMMQKRPKFYSDILIIHTRLSDNRRARLGGFWAQPDLALAYLFGARLILERAVHEKRINEVALPVAYLQRHAFELVLKDLLKLAYAMRADKIWLARLSRSRRATRPDEMRVKHGHQLPKLTSDLVAALKAIGYELPSDVDTMSQKLARIDAGAPDRLRYSTTASGTLSFPRPTVLAVTKTQEQLEALFAQSLAFDKDDEENLATAMVLEAHGYTQALARLGAL